MTVSHSLLQFKKIFFSLLLMTATRLLPAHKMEEDYDPLNHYSVFLTNDIEYFAPFLSDFGFWCYWSEPLAFRVPDQVMVILRKAQANRRKDIVWGTLPEQYMILPTKESYVKKRNSSLIYGNLHHSHTLTRSSSYSPT